MITILLVILTIILIVLINSLFLGMNFLFISALALISTILCIVLDGLVATLVCKLIPENHFIKENKFFKVRKCELKFYNLIKVKKWKDKTLELGFLNGFRKNKIAEPNNVLYIQKFIIECNRGFITHLIDIFICIPLIFFVPAKYQLTVLFPIIVVNAIINYMSVAILRYNTAKLYKIYNHNIKKIST